MTDAERFNDCACVCHPCGTKYGTGGNNQAVTMSYQTCDMCGTENVPCCAPRDYGYARGSRKFAMWD